jgi:hypothetical protein
MHVAPRRRPMRKRERLYQRGQAQRASSNSRIRFAICISPFYLVWTATSFLGSPQLVKRWWPAEAAVGIAVTATGTEKPWRAFPDLDWASERGKRKMKLLNSSKQPTQSFASVLLACSLFGFVFSHHANSANEPHHMNFIQKSEAQQNNDDSWYTPLRSPGFNEDFGS